MNTILTMYTPIQSLPDLYIKSGNPNFRVFARYSSHKNFGLHSMCIYIYTYVCTCLCNLRM